jgi:type I pantothenate kinase
VPDVADLAGRLQRLRPPEGTYVIGVTGGVAVGKTTLAEALEPAIRAWPGAPRVERVSTDGFLRPNRDLEAAGLLARKGFPETYDRAALVAAIGAVKQGPAWFPGYSHLLYDIDPALGRRIDRPGVLILEGLGLDAEVPLDALVYIDAAQADQEAWYVARFLGFWELGLDDPASFYHRFRALDRDAVGALAAKVWREVNLVNLIAHVEPVRVDADLVVRKRADHSFAGIDAGV